MAVESQIRRIEVRIDARGADGLKQVSKGFADVNKNIKNSTNVLTGFKNAFLAIQGLSFAGIGVQQIIQAADAMQKLSDRLNITEGSALGAKYRLEQLTDVSNNNFASIQDTAQIYSRLSQALSDVGVSSSEVVTLTDRLQKTFRLSGATGAEATAATIQLSQGLASGQLRGQELRSVLEANVVVGKLLADQFKITRGELLKFSEKRGGISAADFFEAVANGAKDLDEAANKLTPTIQESLTKNLNDLKLTLLDLNKEFKISEKIIKGLDIVFSNLDIAGVILGIAAAYKTYTFAVGAASGATVSFNAILASSFTGIVVKAGIAVAGFVGALASWPAAIAIGIPALVVSLATMDDFRKVVVDTTKSIGEFLALSIRTPQYQKQYEAQKKAAEELKISQMQLTRSYVLLDNSVSQTDKDLKQMFDTAVSGQAALGPIEKLGLQTGSAFKKSGQEIFNFKAALKDLNNQLMSQEISLSKYNSELKAIKIKDLNQDLRDGTIDNDAYAKSLREIQFGKIKNTVKDYQYELKALNKEFSNSKDIGKYSSELNNLDIEKLNADFTEGRNNLIDINIAIKDIKIKQLNSDFANGRKTFVEYGDSIRALEIDTLEKQLKAGTIGAAEFNAEVSKISEKFNANSSLYTGVNNYIQQAGTISTNIANGITQTFGRLEQSLVDFTTTGKFNFREFTLGVLEDLNRIIIRSLIIRPLAQGILGSIGPKTPDAAGGTTSYSTDYLEMKAKGGAYRNGIEMFATGGVVNSPTVFGHSRGLGIMGEAGPEAILPLKRDGQGNLGVKAAPSNVTVNVINQSGAETEQRESTGPNGERLIDIIITNKVKEAFANGNFDKQMSQQYGLRRRGA